MSKTQAPTKEISGHIEKSELLERLKAWAAFLSEIDQEEDKSELDQICASLISPDLLDYEDADVKLFVACCAADVLRIYAPEAPYADEQLKQIFMMFVEQLRGLEDIEGKSFKRYFYLLENLACVKTFILCMELDAPDIILSLFRTFFQIFNDRHVGKVQTFMVDIMMTVMQEGDSIPQDVMDIILMHIIQPYKSRKPAAHRLAKELINKSATYMEPNIQKFFNAALMKGIETDSGLHSRVYDLIKELNRVCPSILLAVLPQLQEKLKSSDVNERLEVTRLLAEMFSDKGSELATQNKQLWNCFLRRFNDIEAAVRAECVGTCKSFILNHLKLSDDCYANLCKRHRDPDEKVRLEAVKVVYAIASEDITRMTPELFMILQERMLDKKWPIRHQAIMNVARLYKEINSKKDPSKIKQVAWMPNKVLHTYYQNTSQDRLLVERLLLSCLVPVSLGAKDRMNILLRTYCLLDAAAIKALNELLRYQQTIRMHLAALLKAIEQGIGEEDRKKLLNQVSMLSKSLPDSKTANSDLKRLSNTLVHDRSLLKAFQTIVTPGVSCQQVARAVSEIMKKLTNKNPIMDTIRALMDRTAPVLADATCITVLVNLVSGLLNAPREANEDDEDKFNVFINGQKGLHLILSLATVYPGQFKSEEAFEQLLVNLKNSDTEVVLMDLKILAKTAQGLDRRHPNVASALQPQLLKIAKEGSPKQAKQSVQVIHAVYQDSPKVLERLLESMVEMLEPEHDNLPAIIKAVAQIAKVAPKIFEDFSRDVVRDFLLSEILTQDRETSAGLVEDDYWCEEEELSRDARVKMEGLHVMVNWVAQTQGDKTVISTPVLKLLWCLLQQKGDMNGNAEIRLCSMSHLRLHAGLCVLKLAAEPSCYDLIPLELFQEVAWLIQDPCPQVKHVMLTKLQKGLTSMKLPLEYVALLAFFATDVGKERRSKGRQILLRVIQLRREYMVMNSSNSERNHTVLPEYALPTLIHLLAHHPNMDIDNEESLRSALDVLWWFLEPLMQKNDNFPFLKKLVETVKQAVDAIDPFNDTINERMYAVCDLAFGVINVKCANVKLPPFPGEVKLSKKFFAPPEKMVPNTKSYIPEKFDFNPHKAPVAVEMEIDHPTVTARQIVAEDAPIKKKCKKKFVSRKKKPSYEDEEEEEEAEDDKAADDWISEITKKKDDDEDVEMDEVEENKSSPRKPARSPRKAKERTKQKIAETAVIVEEDEEEEEDDPEPEVSDFEEGIEEELEELEQPAKEPEPELVKEPEPEPVNEPEPEPVKEIEPEKEKGKEKEKEAEIEEKGDEPEADSRADHIREAFEELKLQKLSKLKTKPKVVVHVKKKPVKFYRNELFDEPDRLPKPKKQAAKSYRTELFDEPELPKPKPVREERGPQRILKIKLEKKTNTRDAIKRSFNSMYDQLIKNMYDHMPYHKRKSPSPEREVKLPERRLTLVSTRRQKQLGLDKVDLGKSPTKVVTSTPSDKNEKKKLNDIRSFLTPNPKYGRRRSFDDEEGPKVELIEELVSPSEDEDEDTEYEEDEKRGSSGDEVWEPKEKVVKETEKVVKAPKETADSAEETEEVAKDIEMDDDDEVRDVTVSQGEEEGTITIKRGRGRPRGSMGKKRGTDDDTDNSQNEGEKKRGRGRPRKHAPKKDDSVFEVVTERDSDASDVEEEDEDDGPPLLPVGDESSSDEEPSKKPVKSRPVAKKSAPVAKKSTPVVAKKSHPVARKSHPVARKSHPVASSTPRPLNSDKKKRVAPRNPLKPKPHPIEAKIISEMTEIEPSFTEEEVDEEDIIEEEYTEEELTEEEEEEVTEEEEEEVTGEEEEVTGEEEEVEIERKRKRVSAEKENLKVPVTRTFKKPAPVISPSKPILEVSMEDTEPEIKIKRRKTLRQ